MPAASGFFPQAPDILWIAGTSMGRVRGPFESTEKGDSREFRAVTGGVYHSSGGAEKDAIKFDFQKIAPRTYKIVLAGLKKGEYGILPPGGGSVGATGGGASGQTVQGGSM